MGLLTRWTWVWASSWSQAREAWRAVICGVAKSRIRLSDWNEPIKKFIYSFLSSHVQMWEMDHKEGWAPKNWCFRTVVLQKTVESSQEGKEIQPVHPKGNQPWICLGRADAEAEAPILCPPDVKIWLIGKKPWYWVGLRQKEKRVQRMRCLDNIMDVNEHEFKQTPGDSEGQRSLICCSP